MANFTFTLDSFQITDTRSLHKDTDFVTFSVVVNPANGKGVPQVFNKAMGDLNNGTFPLHASFSNVAVAPTDTVVINYLIANSGHQSPGKIEKGLEDAAKALLLKGADALAGLIGIPKLKSLLEDLANLISGEIFGLLDANCDGMVAAEQISLTYDQLVAMTAKGPFRQSTRHPGTDSAHGCGRNSMYIVNWDMLEVGSTANRTVPNVLEMTPTLARQAIQAAGLTASFHGVIQQHTWVASQAPVAGTVVSQGSVVGLTLQAGSPRVVEQPELASQSS